MLQTILRLRSCEEELIVNKDVPIKRQEKIIHMMQENSAITIAQLAHACGVSDKTIKRDIARLKEEERERKKRALACAREGNTLTLSPLFVNVYNHLQF